MGAASKILARIAREVGQPNLPRILVDELAPSDVTSLLLGVFEGRANRLEVPDLLSADRDLFQPSAIDQRVLHQFDALAFQAAEEFEAVELSPVCPLGIHHVLAQVHQNNVLTALRNSEILADPTVSQALECVRRRRAFRSGRQIGQEVKLCGSHRLIRMQPFDVPGFRPHFRLFSLVSAGRDTGSDAFETSALYSHLCVYLRLIRALECIGFRFERISVEISDTEIVNRLVESAGLNLDEIRARVKAHALGSAKELLRERGVIFPDSVEDPEKELGNLASKYPISIAMARLQRVQEQVLKPLQLEFPHVEFRIDLSRLEGLSYYAGLCMKLSASNREGLRLPLADGGITNWTQRLLSDRKERLLTSGIGTESVCGQYRV